MRRSDGVTLIEAVAAVAIMGILALALMPRLQASLRTTRAKSALSTAQTLQFALQSYAVEHGDFPVPAAIADYAGLRSTLAPYVALPEDSRYAGFSFGHYTSVASGNAGPGTYTLVVYDLNNPAGAITITEGALSAAPPPPRPPPPPPPRGGGAAARPPRGRPPPPPPRPQSQPRRPPAGGRRRGVPTRGAAAAGRAADQAIRAVDPTRGSRDPSTPNRQTPGRTSCRRGRRKRCRCRCG